jgi:hypothetical protein
MHPKKSCTCAHHKVHITQPHWQLYSLLQMSHFCEWHLLQCSSMRVCLSHPCKCCNQLGSCFNWLLLRVVMSRSWHNIQACVARQAAGI